MDTESRVDEQLSILTARLRILEVREATRECIARDGFTADLGMVDAYADNYAPDGVSETALEGRGNIVGRDALRTFITSPSNPGSQHLGINMLIHVDGDTAWAEGYSVTTLRQPDDSFKIHLAGYNHWDFARVDGAWKITRRRRCTHRRCKSRRTVGRYHNNPKFRRCGDCRHRHAPSWNATPSLAAYWLPTSGRNRATTWP